MCNFDIPDCDLDMRMGRCRVYFFIFTYFLRVRVCVRGNGRIVE